MLDGERVTSDIIGNCYQCGRHQMITRIVIMMLATFYLSNVDCEKEFLDVVQKIA